MRIMIRIHLYLYCLNDVTINFDDKIISLKEALETNRINIEDIISYIPYQEHILQYF